MNSNSDLIQKCTVGKYDQVFALTQQMINTGFSNLWTKRQGTKQTPFTVSNRTGHLKDVVFDAPQVIIQADAMNHSEVAYRMWFLGGRLQVFKSDDPDDDSTTDIDLTGHYITFMVNIGLAGLPTDDPEYQTLKSVIDSPQDHSITQLLVDLNTAQISNYRRDLSDLPTGGPDWTQTVENNFTGLMGITVLSKLRGDLITALGYQATCQANKLPDSASATFIPTDVRFQTYPWTSPALPTGRAGLSGTDNLNYLCYLETCAGKTPPSGSDVALSITGNWTDGAPTDNNFDKIPLGSFVQSRHDFLEGFLLPKLARLNRASEAVVSNLNVGCRYGATALTFTWDWNVNIAIGHNWWVQDNNPQWNWVPVTDNPRRWEYHSSIDLGEKFDQCGPGVIKLWGSAKSWTSNWLEFQPGTAEITMGGQSYVEIYKSLYNLTTKDDKITYTNTWTAGLSLKAVKDGGLQIVMTHSPPTGSFNNNKDDSDLDTYQDYVQQSFDWATSNFTSLEHELDSELNISNKFIFPAGGVFFFNNPTFTHNGDIACTVEYNGVPEQILSPNQTAAARASVQVTPRTEQPTQPGQIKGSG